MSSHMVEICQNVRDCMGNYYQLMKEEGFVTRGSISSLKDIHKREFDDLWFDESESEVYFIKNLRAAINCGNMNFGLLL